MTRRSGPSVMLDRSRNAPPLRALLLRLAAFLAALPTAFAPAHAASPVVRFITATDVTPRSFQVVWLAGEPATASLRLFEAPDCLNEIFAAEITPFPTVSGDASIVTAAQQKGVMVVRAAGLAPDTEYCVQTVTTSLFSAQTTTSPVPPLRIRTEKKTTRARAAAVGDPNLVAFGNDLAKLSITRATPDAPTAGALVLVKVSGASSPLSGFVGDAIDDDNDPSTPTTLALFNLNNLYDAVSGESLDLLGGGGEEISARALGGPDGFVTVHARIVPADTALSEVVVPLPCRSAPATACDGRLGDADADGGVTLADADAVRDFVVGLLAVPACGVCADVTWDLTDDMKDALAIGQSATGKRTLP
ncbi:MAG TPA: hypothetical protein VFT43_05690 [Candidatus Polarisedimenticolia bacterium]|nr:hypothetical protein [Candidatus Polarisedimenticolia bacterium]